MVPSPTDHDLRDVPPAMHHDGSAAADFSPTADEPDLDIWPRGTDLGASSFSGNPDELVPIYNSVPEPHVRWVTLKQFKYEYGYRPGDEASTIRSEVLDDIRERRRLRLTEHRMTAFNRLARLWNGETVGPADVHLLADKVPSWDEIVADLDQHHLDDLFPTVRSQDQALVDAFGSYDWFESEMTERAWLKTNYIIGVRADYDIEEKARTLINGRDDLPSLRGDPHEGLPHRVGVGLEAVRARTREFCHDIRSYEDVGGYTVDLVETDGKGNRWVAEVLTDHNNTTLYRRTYRKLSELGYPAILVFDNRETLRRVLNHWQRSELDVDVPGAPFGSAPRMSWLREKVAAAARDQGRNWMIEDVFTVTSLWREIFVEGQAPSRRQILSTSW